MAVVKYGCAADVLSGAGGVGKEMTNVALAALNPKGEQALATSLSVEDAVTMVYREGRNKLTHGEMPGLLEDFARPRSVGDALVVDLFDVVTLEIANLIHSGDRILELDEKRACRAFIEKLLIRS